MSDELKYVGGWEVFNGIEQTSTTREKLKPIRDELQEILSRLEWGCGDHGCKIHKPKGMGTNGGCQCRPRYIAAKLLDIAEDIERLNANWRNH